MEQNVVVLVKCDPEQTHRAVEAVRIALGLLSGDHHVSVVLLDKAPLLLGEQAEDLVDGEDLEKYLPPFKEMDQTFYVENKALSKAGLSESEYKIAPVTMQEISDLIARSDRHLIF